MRKRLISWRSRYLAEKSFTIPLTALVISTALMTMWKLKDVTRSEYYAEIPMSMSKSMSNFFFGVLDPSGTVTLDKIPGSYWVPAIFVKIFGFSTWAITAPNALATVAFVVVVALTGRRIFNDTTGIIAGAVAAFTPIVIAVSRSNQPQSFFLLTLSLAGFYSVKAIQDESRKHLVIAGAYIALAFHTYMLEAWALWPALIVAWFFTTGSFGKKVKDLFVAGVTSLALSLTWILIVWLIPASHRPYIGGTYHNNPFEMVFGYNGLGRFSQTSHALSSATDDPTFRSFTPPFGGHAGWGRLFNVEVSGQIAWLIPAAAIGVAILFILKFKKSLSIFLGLWLITFFAMFSMVAGIHQFYTSSLAIPIALTLATAVSEALIQKKHIHIVVLLNVAGLSALFFGAKYSQYKSAFPFIQGALVVLAVLLIFIEHGRVVKYVTPIATIAALVFTPAAWSIDVRNHSNSINPVAGDGSAEMSRGQFPRGIGPNSKRFPGGIGGVRGNFQPGQRQQFNGQRPPQFNGGLNGQHPQGNFQPRGNFGGGFGQQDNSSTIKYLIANRKGARYLLVTFGAQSAASYITATGENVMPIGGFDGSDPTPTLTKFKSLVASGEIRYVLMGSSEGRGGMAAGMGGGMVQNEPTNTTSAKIQRWVKSNCQSDPNAPDSNLYLCSTLSG